MFDGAEPLDWMVKGKIRAVVANNGIVPEFDDRHYLHAFAAAL